MYPIHLHHGPRGVGMDYREFLERFHDICHEHHEEERAKAFAFIFCDMGNGPVIAALHAERGFDVLNEASGHEITVFYLHANAVRELSDDFNSRFMRLLGVADQATPPCVVFFDVYRGEIEDVEIHPIDEHAPQEHLIVEEIRRLLEKHIRDRNRRGGFNPLKGGLSALEFALALKGAFF